jgi:alkylated DNA repair dioxygenase AlkB
MDGNDQLGLFAPQRLVLAEDGEGGIVYRPGVVDPPLAGAWFETLRGEVHWRHERRMMYDREVDVPRLVAHFRLDGPAVAPAAVLEAARVVREAVGAEFNSVGLNFYRDGRDSVAPHNDHLDELVPGFPIALVSLGAARRMTIREKDPPRRAMHLDLEPGSLLTMSHASQFRYLHGIPKQKSACGARISLAFRMRTPGALDDY